jgi:hypothetical protein
LRLKRSKGLEDDVSVLAAVLFPEAHCPKTPTMISPSDSIMILSPADPVAWIFESSEKTPLLTSLRG